MQYEEVKKCSKVIDSDKLYGKGGVGTVGRVAKLNFLDDLSGSLIYKNEG